MVLPNWFHDVAEGNLDRRLSHPNEAASGLGGQIRLSRPRLLRPTGSIHRGHLGRYHDGPGRYSNDEMINATRRRHGAS